jgi:hypothetical protein
MVECWKEDRCNFNHRCKLKGHLALMVMLLVSFLPWRHVRLLFLHCLMEILLCFYLFSQIAIKSMGMSSALSADIEVLRHVGEYINLIISFRVQHFRVFARCRYSCITWLARKQVFYKRRRKRLTIANNNASSDFPYPLSHRPETSLPLQLSSLAFS